MSNDSVTRKEREFDFFTKQKMIDMMNSQHQPQDMIIALLMEQNSRLLDLIEKLATKQ